MNFKKYSSQYLRNSLEQRRTTVKADTFSSPEAIKRFDLPNTEVFSEYSYSNEEFEDNTVDPLVEVPSVEIFNELKLRQKSIYGEDDRIEVYQSKNKKHIQNARSVAAVLKAKDIIKKNDNYVSISSVTLGDKFIMNNEPLCDREPFINQPASAIGSAFLVTPTIIATAHHCINESNYHQRKLYFEFETREDDDPLTTVSIEEIYNVKQYLAGAYSQNAEDWSLLELDRPVIGRKPLEFRREGKATDNSPLYVIGHPSGLPKKIAGQAQIRNNAHDEYFVANLDTYGGNSGSPVFDGLSHLVEGILVRGGTDFVPLGDCLASLICPAEGCEGEHCSRMDSIAQYFAQSPTA